MVLDCEQGRPTVDSKTPSLSRKPTATAVAIPSELFGNQ